MAKRGPKTEAGLQAVSESAKALDHSAWTRNPKAVEAIEVAKRMRQTKHGLYANVPIICKAEACPYSHSCPLLASDLAPYGDKCPIEIAAIEDLFQRYLEEMRIDPEDRRNTVDMMLVKDLVDADIGLLRCDNKMAWDADYVIDNVVGLNDEGEAITKKELHPLTEYKEKLITRKNKTLQLLNSTRKDKEGSRLTVQLDPSERAAQMLKVQQDMTAHLDAEEENQRKYFEKMQGKDSDVIDVEPINLEDEEE
jgi:hypothetical protein